MYMKESGCYMYQGMWKALAVTAICRTKIKDTTILLKHIQLGCLVTFAFSEYSVDITL